MVSDSCPARSLSDSALIVAQAHTRRLYLVQRGNRDKRYSQDQVHHSGTAARPNGEAGDDCEFGSVEEDGDEDAGRPPTK